MTATTRSSSASPSRTNKSAKAPGKATKAKPPVPPSASVTSDHASSPPPNFRRIGDVVAAHSQIPERAAALAAARQRLAVTIESVEGETIRARRLSLGLSQAGLARMLGTSQPHVARIENGLADPNKLYFNTVRKLADALQVNLETVERMLYQP
jgi:ribosome-binding protein aMBF1 (putative translation factor)